MSSRWIDEAPCNVEILENHACVFYVFGLPLRLQQDQPCHGLARTLLQRASQKWRRMAKESDVRMRQSKLFPNQPRQPITLCPAGGIAMSARGEQQATLPGRNAKLTDRSPNHVRECPNDQRMSGIRIIVIDRA